jgi:hypothetical protein
MNISLIGFKAQFLAKTIFASSLLIFIFLLFSQECAKANENVVNCSGSSINGKTLQELGSVQYKKYVSKAQALLRSMPMDEKISFQIGLSCPISADSNRRQNLSESKVLRVIGYLDSKGTLQAITVNDLSKIFSEHSRNIKQSSRLSSSSSLLQSTININTDSSTNIQTLPALDLVIVDSLDNRPYFLPNVRFATFLIDALNAALTNSITVSSYDTNSLNLNEIIGDPIGDEITL